MPNAHIVVRVDGRGFHKYVLVPDARVGQNCY
jgi:tRNA(His) 5'-end guanylyltransferase